MKNYRFRLRNLTIAALGLMAQLLVAQTIGDGPGGVPSSNMMFWYNSSNVRSTTGVVSQWNDGKVPANYLSPSTASTLTYNAEGFTAAGDKIPYYSVPSTTSLSEVLPSARANQSGYEIWVVAKAIGANTAAGNKTMRLFKITNAALSNNYAAMVVPYPASSGAPWAFQIQNTSAVSMQASNTAVITNTDRLYYTYLAKTGTSTASAMLSTTGTLTTAMSVSNAGLVDFSKLTLNDIISPNPYGTYAVAEVFGFTANTVAAQKTIIQNYIARKYFSADAYKFDYVETNSSFGATGSVNSGVLKLSTTVATQFAVAHDYQGALTHNLATTLPSPFSGLKVRNQEWKVVTNGGNTSVAFSIDQSLLTSIDTKTKIPFLIVKSNATTVTGIYPMSLSGAKYTTAPLNVALNSLVQIGYMEATCTSSNTLTSNYIAWNTAGLTSTSIAMDAINVARTSTGATSGVLSLTQTGSGSTFTAANPTAKLPIEFSQVSSKKWCVSKIGDISNIEKFSIRFNTASYPVGTNYNMGYNIIVDPNGDDNLTDAVIYTTSDLGGGSQGVNGVNLPNGSKFSIALDLMNVAIAGASTVAIPSSFFTHATFNSAATYASLSTNNDAYIRRFHRYFNYLPSAPNVQAVLTFDKRLFTGLMGFTSLQPHQVPVIIESSSNYNGTTFSQAAKVYACTAPIGNVYTFNVSFKTGFFYTLGIIDQQTTAGYTNFRATSGVLDLNYNVPAAEVSNEFKFFTSTLSTYNHIVALDNGGNYTLSATMGLGTVGQYTYIPYKVTSKAFKVLRYNNTSTLNIGFHKSLLNTDDIPDEYYEALIIDTDGNWATTTDRSVVGMVRSGDYYYAFDQNITAQSFAFGVAKQSDVHVQHDVHEISFTNIPTTLPVSDNLVVNRLTNFNFASACKETVNSNVLKLLVNTGETFQWGLDKTLAKADFTVDVTVDLTYKNQAGATLGAVETKTLQLTGKYPEALYSKVLPVGTQTVTVSVKTISTNSATPAVVDLAAIRAALEVKANIIQNTAKTTTKTRLVSYVEGYIIENTDGKPVQLGWSANDCSVEGYKVQILRLYNNDPTKVNTTTFEATADVDWSKALTLETKETTISLQLAEGSGYYIWRVMPYGNSFPGGVANSNNWGNWSTDNLPAATVLNLSDKLAPNGYGVYVFYHTQLEDDKNFIYNRTFTEDGKTQETLTIADGLEGVRQTQTKLNSNIGEGNLIINQNIYDYSGRIATTTLPAPILDADQAFGYRSEFIKEDVTNTAYGPWSVDVKPDQMSGDNYVSATVNAKVSDNSLLGKYYSEQNPDPRVPNALKYPISRVVYSTDGNNSILEQGNVGDKHQPFGGKTVKQSTATASPNELIRLFGDETPEGIYRTAITDQNGTTSIAYTNRSGNTIATCLLVNDDAKSPLKMLPSGLEKVQGGSTGNPTIVNDRYTVLSNKTILDKIENQIKGNVIVSSQDFDLVGNQSVGIDYTYQPSKFLLDQCEKFCVTCGYKVEVYIYNLSTGTLAATAGTSGNTANPVLEWLNPATYPNQAAIDTKINTYTASSPATYTLGSWTGANTSSTSTITLAGGNYRLYKVIKQATEDDAKNIATQIENKMNAVVEAQIINPIKAKMALGTMKYVNKYIFETLLTSYITAGASEPNFGAYVELIRTDIDGNQTALLANSKKTSAGSYFRDASMTSYMSIKDDMKLKIVTSCCTLFVQLYEHRPDLCSPKEYLTEIELADANSDHLQLYQNATHRATMISGLGNSLVEYTRKAILDNAVAATDPGFGFISTGDPIAFLQTKFNGSVTPAYTATQFTTMTTNMITDFMSWKIDSLALATPALRDQSKYKIFENLTCDNISDSWKAIVQKYFAPIPNELRAAMQSASPSAMLSTDNPGVNLDGVNSTTLDGKTKKDPIDEHISNIGYTYIGYVTSGDVKTQAYKLFLYNPRNSKCETMFCSADMNAGYNLTKMEQNVDKLNGETPSANLEPATTYPDITIQSVKDAMCRSYMSNSTDPNICMPETEAIGTSHTKYLGSNSTSYNALKVRLYSQLAVTPAQYRYLNAIEYDMLKKCDEADDENAAATANGSVDVDDIALAETENSIRAIRTKLLNDCNMSCDQKYNSFYTQLAKMYDPDGDGQYYSTTKKIYGLELVKNGGFASSLAPATYTLGDWGRIVNGVDSRNIPVSDMVNSNINLATSNIFQQLTFTASKTYVVTFDVVEKVDVTSLEFKLGAGQGSGHGVTASFTQPLKTFTTDLKVGENTFTFTHTFGPPYAQLGLLMVGGANKKLIIDNVSVREITYSTTPVLISADDICCTAYSLVEACKEECVLTEQILECNPLPTMKAQIYYRTNLDIPATWKRAPNASATDITIPTNAAGVYPSLSGANAYNINLNVVTKQYYQVYVKAIYEFSNQKSVEVVWGKNYAPQTPQNLTFTINQQAVTLATKGSGDPVFTINDGTTTYNSPSKISEVYKYLEAAKTSASCNGAPVAAVTLTRVTYKYSYDGLKTSFKDITLSGTSLTVPMRDPAPNVVLEMKVRFIYTASGVSGDYKESCITKIDLGAVQGAHTYSPYFGLNRRIDTYNGASSTLSNITGTTLYLVEGTSLKPGSSACDSKDMFQTQTVKRRVTVAPGTPAQLNTVNAIIKGNYLLKPYCTTSCPDLTGYKLVNKAKVNGSCGVRLDKPQIKWQNSISTFLDRPDLLMKDKNDNFLVLSNCGDFLKMDKNTGTLASKAASYNPKAGFSTGNDYWSSGSDVAHILPGKTASTYYIITPSVISGVTKVSTLFEYNSDLDTYTSKGELSHEETSTNSPDGIINRVTSYNVVYNSMKYVKVNGGYICLNFNGNYGYSDNPNHYDRYGGTYVSIMKYNEDFVLQDINPNDPNLKSKTIVLPCGIGMTNVFQDLFLTYDPKDNSLVFMTAVENTTQPCGAGLTTHGKRDLYIAKIDASYNKVWEKVYGGNDNEILQRYYNTEGLLPTDDGGYIFAAATMSDADGSSSADPYNRNTPTEKVSAVGILDYWVVKIDRFGNKQWDKTLGGNDHDYPIGGLVKYKGHYVIAGKSFSNGKDLEPTSDRTDALRADYHSTSYIGQLGNYTGNSDAWVVILDKNGNQVTDIAFGGRGLDYPISMATNANSVVLGCHTLSSMKPVGSSELNDINVNVSYSNWFVSLNIPEILCNPQPVYVRWLPPTTGIPPECTTPPCNPCPDCVQDPPTNPTKEKMAKISQTLDMTFARCKNAKTAAIMEAYTQNCIKPQQRETFSLQYSHAFHHYTLYYYDRGGNLIKTVPPAGVEPLALTDLPTNASAAQIATYKANLATLRNTATNHRMATQYTYNNQGLMVDKTTPDGGKTTYLYDKVFRMRFSQSAQQKIDNKFSYTKYDNLSRVIEVGEATYTSGVTSFDQLSAFVEGVGNVAYPTSGKTEYIVTVYSKPMNTVLQIAGPQRNIQNRISYSYSLDIKNRRAVTYYSYDAHGNVEWIIQDIPGFSQYLIGYEYDLVNNNVVKVSFNKGRPDAFYHRYEYDADNRITAVYTSKNDELWDKDASYDYFKHGPLRRTVLGEDQVQGLDYTYTIHGWLKAINSHNKGALNDPSKDGAPANGSDPESKVAIDEWAMMLQYYTGDFTRTSSPFMENILPTTGTTAKDLFNGNISAWHSRIPEEHRRLKTATTAELATLPVLSGQQYTYTQAYTYDELNRIVASEAFKYTSRGDVIPVGSSPFTATEDYKTSYSYDANGNLLTLNRNGFIRPDGNGKDMDKFRYKYNLNGSNKPTNNKLRGIDDDVLSDVYGSTDINDQYEEENYLYDANGNLITDYEGQTNIVWNASGKVSEVNPLNVRSKVRYIYDAQGNRIAKELVDFIFGGPGYGATTTAYVRDAQGNVMAVYEKRTSGGYDGFSNTFKQKEVHLYGSSRLGVYTPDNQVAEVTTTRSGIDRQYIYEDVQQRAESNNLKWIQHIDKTQTVNSANKLYRYLVYATQTYNTTNGEYMNANSTINNLAANANKNIFQAEDKAGNILFSGFVARSYMGKSNVALLFNSSNTLMANSGGLNMDPNAESAVVQIPNSNDFMLISRGLDKKLYYHTISTTTGVLTKNTELVSGTTGYSPAIAVIEDFAQGKVVVYTTKFDGVGLSQKIVAITITKPSTAIVAQSADLYTQYSTGVEDCELKIAPKGNKISVVTFSNDRQGFFEHRTSFMRTFNIGNDYKFSDLDPDPATIANGIYIQPSTYQFEIDGHYELPVESYRSLVNYSAAPILDQAYGPLMRRPDGQLSAFYNNNTPGFDMKPTVIGRMSYGYFVVYNIDGLTTTVSQLLGAKIVPYTHVSSFRKYAITVTDPIFTREVGAKSYELTDHLGDVSVVVSDLVYKVYPSTSTNTKVVLASTVKPEGLYAQVLSYTNYYPFGMPMVGRNFISKAYRYAYQGQEKGDELPGDIYNYTYRMHDARIGRFMAVDPLAAKYPYNSAYAFSENRVIDGIELEGLEFISVNNSGVSPEDHKNTDGTYSFNLDGISVQNATIVSMGGQDYFDVKQDLYYGDKGWSNTNSGSDLKMTVDVAAAPYLFSPSGLQNLIKRTTTFSNTTDKQTLPTGSTGWCLNWLQEQCVAMYGGKGKDYGDRITKAMEAVAKGGNANAMIAQYALTSSGTQIRGAGNSPATKPTAASFSPNVSQTLVDQVGNSPGLFLFAVSPGNGFHCIFVIMDNRDVSNKVFYTLDNHGVKTKDAAGLETYYVNQTNNAINYYNARGNDWNVGVRKWILKE